MIAELRGKVTTTEKDSIVIDISGVGYLVHTILTSYKEGDDIHLYTHLAVRENSMDLYGFVDKEELSFFELLIGISGIGPRSALAILNLTDVGTLKSATATGDISYLTKVSGIGKKNAQKIVLELRDKIATTGEYNLKEESEALEALSSLGYSTKEARDALKNVPQDERGGDWLKNALKLLGK